MSESMPSSCLQQGAQGAGNWAPGNTEASVCAPAGEPQSATGVGDTASLSWPGRSLRFSSLTSRSDATGILDTQIGSSTPCHIFSLELEIMVSHSEQEGRLQVLEVCARTGQGSRDRAMLGQGYARLENGGTRVWSLWQEGGKMHGSAKARVLLVILRKCDVALPPGSLGLRSCSGLSGI